MEEDIKILEQFLRGNKYCKDCKSKCVDCYIEYEEVQAVANLIKAYKEYEECLEVTSLALNNIAYDQIPIAIEDLKLSSIPKSKVKEKIKELEEKLKYYESLDLPEVDDNGIRTGLIKNETILILKAKIQVLKELLQELLEE